MILYLNRLKIILQSKLFLVIFLIFTCLYVFVAVKVIKYESKFNFNETKFIGQVVRIKITDYGYSITVRSKEDLVVYTEEFPYQLGDTLLIEGELNPPSNNTVFNNFNYKEYLYQNKIFYTVSANNIKLLEENQNIFFALKNKLIKYMNTFKSHEYLKSFILGDTSYLDNDLYESYQINGICHLLAIGSSHITFLSLFLLFIFKKLKCNESFSKIILFLIIFLFLLLTDYPISIVRVYLYMILSFLNKKLNLNLSSIKLFIFVLLITLFVNPFYIYHKGFLYSYSISFILILNKDKLTGNYLMKLLKISFISFLYSIPFNIYFNFSINLFSIIYNLFYVPIFNIVVFPISLLTLIFPFLDSIFYQIMNGLNYLSYFLNDFTLGIIILKKISLLILIVYLVIITYVIKDWFSKKKKSFLLLLLILIFHFYINDLVPNDYFVIIDVKQGDSSLFYSNNKTVLVDTGGIFNQQVSKKTILMLKSFGIKKIDYLFLTHGDYDHMGDSIYFLNNFQVSNVIFNSNDMNDLEQELLEELKLKKIKYSIGYQGMTYTVNNLKIKLLNTAYQDENDSSLVLYMSFNDKKILLMGDASKTVEQDLIDKYDLPNIDYLKVGHHGSKTSTSSNFVDVVNPKYSIISVGKNNLYNHPNPEVLANLSNTKIYRTDDNGSILFKFKKNKVIIKTSPS